MSDCQRTLDCLASGRYRTTLHARQRMALRGVSHTDIMVCGTNGNTSIQDDGKIKVTGTDQDGDELALICVFEGDVLIITVF